MTTTGTSNKGTKAGGGNRPKQYVGEVVYIFAFDVAYEMTRLTMTHLLGQPVVQYEMEASKRVPRQVEIHRPKMVNLPVVERVGPHGPVLMQRAVKIVEVGAISITIRIPFAVNTLEELVAYHDVQLGGIHLHGEVCSLAGEVARELRPYLIRPHERLMEEEAYTVFCLQAPIVGDDGAPVNAEKWLQFNRRSVAALLTQEPDAFHLSHQETMESTQRYLSYYERDIVVVDWDAALIVDDFSNCGEVLFIMELANLQLAELEAYDRILDQSLERAYRDVAQQKWVGQKSVMRQLRELRVDLARFDDELSNITKFFGDWHLARIYKHLAARFHLSAWHRTTEEKLRTVGELYQLISHDQNNRAMLFLEFTIVLLFIVDLVILFMGLS